MDVDVDKGWIRNISIVWDMDKGWIEMKYGQKQKLDMNVKWYIDIDRGWYMGMGMGMGMGMDIYR